MNQERSKKMMHQTRDLIISVTEWYLHNIHSLPDSKHRQYIRLMGKLKERHNRYAFQCNGDYLR